MNKNLVTRLTTLLLLASMSGCSAPLFASCSNRVDKENLEQIISTISAESTISFKSIKHVVPEKDDENYYMSLIAHNDSKEIYPIGWHSKLEGYEDHQDYRITYQISKQNYSTLCSICNNKPKVLESMTNTNVKTLLEIIYCSDIYEVENLSVENDSLHTSFDESFKFTYTSNNELNN